MYGISYEKCICFVFLVVVAVLSCTGFPIDDLAMTDLSKRNPLIVQPPPGAFGVLPPVEILQHRIRHHHRPPRSHETPVRRRNRGMCSPQDITLKAYMANTVVHATTESVKHNHSQYSVVFKVIKTYKKPKSLIIEPKERILLHFRNQTESAKYCERNDPTKLVKANILQSKTYILFLNAHGQHNYYPYGAPEIFRKGQNKKQKAFLKVMEPNFQPKPPEIKLLKIEKSNKNRLKLVCNSSGLPIPTLSWRFNGRPVHPEKNRTRITYKKRNSTLVILNPNSSNNGRYQCIARGVNNTQDSKYLDVQNLRSQPSERPSSVSSGTINKSSHHNPNSAREPSFSFDDRGRPCDERLNRSWCYNGGLCHYIENVKEYYCGCPPGFSGHRCEFKVPSKPSTYVTSLYPQPCNSGLFTKYNC